MGGSRNTRRAPFVLAIALAGGSGCARVAPTPYGAALVVVDTDAPVPSLVNGLRIDIFGSDGTWLDSRDEANPDPTQWPMSFTVYSTDLGRDSAGTVRLRAYAEGQVRDYRGERFGPVPSGAPSKIVPDPAPTSGPRLVQNGVDVTPATEPLPGVTIDRLVGFTLSPGVTGTVSIVLSSQCFGTMADLAGGNTCTGTQGVIGPVGTATIAPGTALPPPSTRVGTLGQSSGCTVTPRAASTVDGGTPLYDEEVCIPGGAFMLGSTQADGIDTIATTPERIAVMPPMLVDRYELTVARYRAALNDGFNYPGEAYANDAPLGTSSSDPATSRCTLTDTPMGRETYPLNCVSEDIARAFCQFEGGDILTEAEWEYVASASSRPYKTTYPWGESDPTCAGVVFGRSDQAGLNECSQMGLSFGPQPTEASLGGDTTPGSVVAMGGSLKEWVLDAPDPYDSVCWEAAPLDAPQCTDKSIATRATRGGSWNGLQLDMVTAVRGLPLTAADGTPDVGLRCARKGTSP